MFYLNSIKFIQKTNNFFVFLLLLLTFLVSIISCNRYEKHIKNTNIEGLWYIIDKDTNYYEYSIDSNVLSLTSEMMGKGPTHKYNISSDSIFIVNGVEKLVFGTILLIKENQFQVLSNSDTLTFTKFPMQDFINAPDTIKKRILYDKEESFISRMYFIKISKGIVSYKIDTDSTNTHVDYFMEIPPSL